MGWIMGCNSNWTYERRGKAFEAQCFTAFKRNMVERKNPRRKGEKSSNTYIQKEKVIAKITEISFIHHMTKV